MLSSPVFAKLQPRSAPPSRSPSFRTDEWPGRLQISYPKGFNGRLYPFSFQSLIVSSSPSRSNGTPRIPFISLSLRRLFFATGGYTPSPSLSRLPPVPISSISRRPSYFSSTAYRMLLPQLLCFDNHPFSWGCTPLPLYFTLCRCARAHELRTFLPRAGARGARQLLLAPNGTERCFPHIRFSWGEGVA
jgi:hypothetical protein